LTVNSVDFTVYGVDLRCTVNGVDLRLTVYS